MSEKELLLGSCSQTESDSENDSKSVIDSSRTRLPKKLATDDPIAQERKVNKKLGKLEAAIGTMVVIGVAAAIIVGCIVGFSNGAPSTSPKQIGFTIDDILYGKYSASGFNGSWISDTEILHENDEGLVIYDVRSQTRTQLVSAATLEEYHMNGHWLSKDRRFLLFNFEETKIWRHSTTAKYSVLDIATSAVYPVTIEGYPEQPKLQFASFSPTDNSIIFVFSNNIYYKPNPVDAPVRKITDDGSDSVFNGVPDWVYEEEVLSSDNAIWFSPQSTKLAYATFHDENVKMFDFPYYGAPGDLNWQYPRSIALKYPKPGKPNPVVTLTSMWVKPHTVRVRGARSVFQFNPPGSLTPNDCVFTTATWANDAQFFIIWSNRVQNESYFTMCDAYSGACSVIHQYKAVGGWNEFFTPPTFNSDGSKFLIIHSVDVPASDGFQTGKYKHVVLFENSGRSWSSRPLTHGHFEITDILSWDEVNDRVYVIGTAVGKPSERHLYEINVDGPTPLCLTCNSGCTWNSVKMSDRSSYYSHNCAGPSVPEIKLKTTENHTPILDWELNTELKESLQNVTVPTYEYRTNIQVGGANSPYKANVKLIMPPDFDPNNPGARKYPVVVNVYGGPSSQQVTEAFGFGWGHYFASQGMIYALIDGRGSGFQGENILFEIYRGMGTVEIEDQISVMKELQKEVFVDANRTAIWGWSYGGFATASALAKDVPDANGRTAFKCGMSVAPVTNWIYYDSIYTERYMSTPQDNEIGYNRSDVTRNVENFRNKKFYLLHGTADDNVHYQQSMMLDKALEKEDILFRSQSYPDENHSIGSLKRHVYHSLTAFLVDDCFHLESNNI